MTASMFCGRFVRLRHLFVWSAEALIVWRDIIANRWDSSSAAAVAVDDLPSISRCLKCFHEDDLTLQE